MLKKLGILFVATFMLAGCTQLDQLKSMFGQSDQDDAMMVEEESLGTEDAMMEDDSLMMDKDASDDAMMMESETLEIEVEMSSYKFNPDEIRVKAGQTVTIKLHNAGGIHDFVIDELDVASEESSTGEDTEVTFTVPEDAAGESYEYYCGVGNHRQLGMVGMLIVE